MKADTAPADSRYARRVGAAIRAEMHIQDLSQADLADRVGEGQPWISRRLSGTVIVDVVELGRIAAALGVPVAQLLPVDPAVAR